MAEKTWARGPKSERIWAEAIRMAVLREGEENGKKSKYINILANKIVALAAAGDTTAIKEIGDRLDGKPKQQTELTGADGGPIEMTVQQSQRDAAVKAALAADT